MPLMHHVIHLIELVSLAHGTWLVLAFLRRLLAAALNRALDALFRNLVLPTLSQQVIFPLAEVLRPLIVVGAVVVFVIGVRLAAHLFRQTVRAA